GLPAAARPPNSTDAPTRFGTRMSLMTSMRERGFRRRRRYRLPWLLACGALLAAVTGRAQTDSPPEPLDLPEPPAWPDLEPSPDGAAPDSATAPVQDDTAAADGPGAAAAADSVDPAAAALDPAAESGEPRAGD